LGTKKSPQIVNPRAIATTTAVPPQFRTASQPRAHRVLKPLCCNGHPRRVLLDVWNLASEVP